MEKISNQNPLLTIWPEGHVYYYQHQPSVRASFEHWLNYFNTHLLFVDNHYLPKGVYNSIFWLDNQGILQDIYHKRSLVPFGEYLPMQKYYQWLLNKMGLKVGSFQSGEKEKIFSIAGMKIAPLICYESIVPSTAAKSIGSNGAGKVFVLVSNNGWYGSLYQVHTHSMISSLRAVENRVPLIHVINNGYSSVTMPDGRVVFKTDYLKKGVWTMDLNYNANIGGSFYSKYPNWFSFFIKIVVLFFFVFSFLHKKLNFYRKINDFF